MKNTLISRICCLTIICFCGFSPLAYLRAQQSVAVTPEVKADTLRRLESARAWLIPSSDDWINPTTFPKGNIKQARNLCNKGPHGSDDQTQQAGCLSFLQWTKYDDITSASLDELMPVFKLCAVGGQEDCARAMEFLIKTGHPDYSLAIAEYASKCNGCIALWDFSLGPDGYHVSLTPGALYSDQVPVYAMVSHPGWVMGQYQYSIHVTNPSDVTNLLRIGCLGNGSQLACQWYQQTGVAVSESQREQATANQQATEDRAAAAKDEQSQRGQQHSQESAQAWNNVVSAVAASTPTIQETAAQNQANLQAAAKSAQQRQQVQEQDRLAAEQIARDAQTSTSITRPAPILSNTSVGSGSIQGSCTDMTGSVQGSVKIGTDGWVIGYLTNNSNQTLFVSYTFKQNGVPSTAMANAGGTTIQAGQTVGGEGQGLYSTGADKNPPEIYWYAVLKSEHDQYGCVHKW